MKIGLLLLDVREELKELKRERCGNTAGTPFMMNNYGLYVDWENSRKLKPSTNDGDLVLRWTVIKI